MENALHDAQRRAQGKVGPASHSTSTRAGPGTAWRRFLQGPFLLSLKLLLGDLSGSSMLPDSLEPSGGGAEVKPSPESAPSSTCWKGPELHRVPRPWVLLDQVQRVPIPGCPGRPGTLALFCFLPSSGAHFPVGPRALRRLPGLSPATTWRRTSPACLPACLPIGPEPGPGQGLKPNTQRGPHLAGSGAGPTGSLA